MRRKENVSPRRRQILSRSRRWRNGSNTVAEKRGTKYLICDRTELAPRWMKRTFHLVHERGYYRTLPSKMATFGRGNPPRPKFLIILRIFFVIATIALYRYYTHLYDIKIYCSIMKKSYAQHGYKIIENY